MYEIRCFSALVSCGSWWPVFFRRTNERKHSVVPDKPDETGGAKRHLWRMGRPAVSSIGTRVRFDFSMLAIPLWNINSEQKERPQVEPLRGTVDLDLGLRSSASSNL